MTPREMQSAFELEYNKYDSKDMTESHIIFYWLNQAQEREVKTSYSGVNSKGESFESSQKRIDDLRTLVKEEKINITSLGTKPNSVIGVLPIDYWFKLGDEVDIEYTNINTITTIKRTGLTDCTVDTYNRQISDPYSPHRLHYDDAKPLRLFYKNQVEIITDDSYSVNYYYLRYLKKPNKIDLKGSSCELPEHMHSEIVTKAVNLYLETTGNNRYQSNKIELNTNE